MLIEEFVALLTTDTLPVASPTATGVNAIFSATDCPGVSLVPASTPPALNPDPESVTLAIVTLEFPLFVSTTANELLLSTFTFPKIKRVGFASSSKVGFTPVPLSETANGEDASLTSETEPVTLSAEVGANTALNVVLLPAAIVTGVASPVIPKTFPERLA